MKNLSAHEYKIIERESFKTHTKCEKKCSTIVRGLERSSGFFVCWLIHCSFGNHYLPVLSLYMYTVHVYLPFKICCQ